MKDPRRLLSPHVAEAFEQTPAFIASMEGSRIIPTTWGDLASRLTEAGIVEPDVDAVCDYLLIDREALAGSEFAISHPHDINVLRNDLQKDSEQRFWDNNAPIAHEFAAYMDERSAEWEVANGEERGDQIQEEIKTRIDDESITTSEITALLCLERDASYSGIVVPLPEFLEAIFNDFKGQPFFTRKDLGDGVVSMLDKAMRDYVISDTSKVQVEDVVIGKEQIQSFMQATKFRFDSKGRESADAKWNALQPFLIPPEPTDYPLIERV